MVAPRQRVERRDPSCTRIERPYLAAAQMLGLFGVATAIHGCLLRNQLGANLAFDVARDFRMLLQEVAGIVLALSDAFALVAVPRAGFFHQIVQHTELDELAFLGDAGAVQERELGLAERRRLLVLDDFDASQRSDHFLATLDRADAPNVQAHGRIEFQRVAAGGGFRIAEHDADLHSDLIDEYHDGVRALDVAGQLAQRLGHEARLQTHVVIAHLALDFRLRRERRHRIDHHHIDSARAHQHIGNLQRLFTRVRLRHQQVIDLDAQLLRVYGVERILGINESRGSPVALRRGDDGQPESRGYWGFGAEY